MRIEVNGLELRESLKVIKTGYVTVAAVGEKITVTGIEKSKTGHFVNAIEKTVKDGQVKENGSITLAVDSLKMIKNEDVIISDSEIIGKKRTIKFKSEDGKEAKYSSLENKICSLNGEEFNTLKSCLYAVAQDEARPILQHIFMDSKNFIALDGYRMTVKGHGIVGMENELMINADVFKLIKAIKKVESFEIFEQGQFVEYVVNEEYRVTLNKIEGNYIKYQSLLPAFEDMKKITIDRDEFIAILKDYKNIKAGANNLVKLNIVEEKLETTYTGEKTEVKDSFIIENKQVLDMDLIGFNRLYIIDALNQLEKGSKAEIWIKSNVTAGIIKSGVNEDINLILPVRVIR